ncbi:MAG TPA: 4-hydroxy-3-methylbut-2-enyl diphosphate reductase [Haloplasmataceae bacterium]
MKVIKVAPRGFCVGVVEAINIAIEAAFDETVPKPIQILGNIVHNQHISKAFEEIGLITIDHKGKTRLELLDEVNEGTVILTAHGVSDAVRLKAREKGLYVIDATCVYVTKSYDYIKKKLQEGYEVLYIGKRHHPEPEGALGIDPQRVHLIESIEDVKALNLTGKKIAITNQTTMSYWDIEELAKAIQAIYPDAEFENEICDATQKRQAAVLREALKADLTIVVGDPLSNNTARLAQVSDERAGTKAYRIGSVEDIQLEWLEGVNTVAVTSGASTPTALTNEVIEFLENYDPNDPKTHIRQSKVTTLDILPRIKAKIRALQQSKQGVS